MQSSQKIRTVLGNFRDKRVERHNENEIEEERYSCVLVQKGEREREIKREKR